MSNRPLKLLLIGAIVSISALGCKNSAEVTHYLHAEGAKVSFDVESGTVYYTGRIDERGYQSFVSLLDGLEQTPSELIIDSEGRDH